MNKLSPEHADKLKSQPEWQALEQHIRLHIEALDSCTGISETETDVALASRSRKKAVEILAQILEPFYSPLPEQETDRRKEAREKLGLL